MFHLSSPRDRRAQEVIRGQFNPAVLEAVQKLGQPLDITDRPSPGLWLGMRKVPDGVWEAAVTGLLQIPSHVEGY